MIKLYDCKMFYLLTPKVYKVKSPVAPVSSGRNNVSQWLHHFQTTYLSDLTTSIGSSLALVIAGFLQLQFNSIETEEYNKYPNYLFEYFYRLIRPTVTGLFIVSFYYYRHHGLRVVMWNECKRCLACN